MKGIGEKDRGGDERVEREKGGRKKRERRIQERERERERERGDI